MYMCVYTYIYIYIYIYAHIYIYIYIYIFVSPCIPSRQTRESERAASFRLPQMRTEAQAHEKV